MGLGLGLGLSTLPLSFAISSLFSNGEQGAIYDPSVMSSMYQDVAGTTPVTAVEQPVGLMLDRRFGLVRGAELITNGDFSAGTTGWGTTNGMTLDASSGALVATNTAALFGRVLSPSFAVVAGTSYEVTITCVAGSQRAVGNVMFHDGTTQASALGAGAAIGATVKQIVAATVTGVTRLRFENQSSTTGDSFTIDNISIKAIPGNHATQATAAARPVLSARKNLLQKTEQFDFLGAQFWAYGNKGVTEDISADAAVAPDGTMSADLFTALATVHLVATQQTVTPGTTYAFSWHAKLGTLTSPKCGIRDVTNGVAINDPAAWPAGVDVGAGWKRYTLTVTAPAGCTSMSFRIVHDSGMTGTLYLWGAQLEYGTTATRYQRVNTATDYDAVGFPVYLRGDGVDDCALNTTYAPGTAQTVVQALAYYATNASQDSFSALGNDGGIGLALDSGGQFYFRYGTGAALGSLKPISRVAPAGVPVVFGGWSDGSNIGTFVNSDADTTAAVAVPAHSPAGFTVFAWTGGAVERANAAIYGHVHVARKMTTAEKESVKRWLAAKAGITF